MLWDPLKRSAGLISPTIAVGLCPPESHNSTLEAHRLEVHVKSIHLRGPRGASVPLWRDCRGPHMFLQPKTLFTQHPLSDKPNYVNTCTCCYTPSKYCSDHGLQYTAGIQELLTTPHSPLSTQHVTTEYLNSFNNSDDIQVLLRLVCF